MKNKPDKKFWKKRAQNYNKLSWTRKQAFVEAMIRFCEPRKSYVSLDLGSGTGVIAQQLAKKIGVVIGIDISEDMIRQALCNNNVLCQLMNAEELKFPNNFFDLITARMVFHHINDPDKAMREAYRVLKKGRRLVICEGVPPNKEARHRYVEIFKLKEERHTFLPEDLECLYKRAKFKNIVMKPYVMEQVSMKNWLGNSGLSDRICNEIVGLHLEASEQFKEAYKMKISGDDILMDWKFLFISGEK